MDMLSKVFPDKEGYSEYYFEQDDKDVLENPHNYEMVDGMYQIKAPPPPTLDEFKQQKITEVTQAYNDELNSTFTSSATETELIYDFSPNSQTLWKELQSSIDGNYLPDTIFPMNITLADGTVVPHTKAQLQQIFGEVTLRKLQLYGKLQSMVTVGGLILSCENEEELNLIMW